MNNLQNIKCSNTHRILNNQIEIKVPFLNYKATTK